MKIKDFRRGDLDANGRQDTSLAGLDQRLEFVPLGRLRNDNQVSYLVPLNGQYR
jgi:hypothetical protein